MSPKHIWGQYFSFWLLSKNYESFVSLCSFKIIRGTLSGLSLETLIALTGIHKSDEIRCVKMNKDKFGRTFQTDFHSNLSL